MIHMRADWNRLWLNLPGNWQKSRRFDPGHAEKAVVIPLRMPQHRKHNPNSRLPGGAVRYPVHGGHHET
jgi:hypothetical protein